MVSRIIQKKVLYQTLIVNSNLLLVSFLRIIGKTPQPLLSRIKDTKPGQLSSPFLLQSHPCTHALSGCMVGMLESIEHLSILILQLRKLQMSFRAKGSYSCLCSCVSNHRKLSSQKLHKKKPAFRHFACHRLAKVQILFLLMSNNHT